MRFYGREYELSRLEETSQSAQHSSHLTMITGRRRVGKTTLVKHFLETYNVPSCYFFVSRKQPAALLKEFTEILVDRFPEISGLNLTEFEGFFKFVFQKLNEQNFTLVLDEFQNFRYVDASVFSILQKYWDEWKEKISGHIIVIGSVQTMMHRIFESKKEPLFRRLTGKFILRPFVLDEMYPLFQEHGLNPQTALERYLIFNGVPFYYALMEKEQLFGSPLSETIDRLVLRHDGILFNEGRDLTVEEFGRNYGKYFSILEAIAGGHTQWNNIATQSGIPPNSLGKYLNDLLKYYGVIERRASVFSKDTTKASRYYLKDCFLTFWFRYVHENLSLLEDYSSNRVLQKVQRDLPNFFGFQFEQFVLDWLRRRAASGHPDFPFDEVGRYWDRGMNEIDVVAYQGKEVCLVGECKWNSKRVDLKVVGKLDDAVELARKAKGFRQFQRAVFVGDTMPIELKEELQKREVKVSELADYWRRAQD